MRKLTVVLFFLFCFLFWLSTPHIAMASCDSSQCDCSISTSVQSSAACDPARYCEIQKSAGVGVTIYWCGLRKGVTPFNTPAPTGEANAVCANWEKIPGCTCTGDQKDVPSLGCLAGVIISVINFATAFLASVTAIIFLAGALKYVISRGDPKALESAQKTMTYAIFGFLLVFATFIIINFITTALGLGNILTNFTLYQG